MNGRLRDALYSLWSTSVSIAWCGMSSMMQVRSGLRSSSGKPMPFCGTSNNSIRYSNPPAGVISFQKTTDASGQYAWSSDSWMSAWRSSRTSLGNVAGSWERGDSFTTQCLLTIVTLKRASMAFGFQNQTPRVTAPHRPLLRRQHLNSNQRLHCSEVIVQPPGQVQAPHRQAGTLRLKSIVRDGTS